MQSTAVKPGYKVTELGVIPEDWSFVSLQQLASEIGDGIHATPIYDDNGDYYFVNGNNLDHGQLVFTETTKKVNYKEYTKYKKELSSSTIFMSINGTIGNLAKYNNELIILGKSAAYITLKKNCSFLYIYHLLQSCYVQNYFYDGLTGSTIKNLGLGTIRNTPIILPLLPEQKAIASALSDVDALLTAQEALIAKKRDIKTATMQQLLTGKVRLGDFGQRAGATAGASEAGVPPGYQQTELGVIPEDWEVTSLGKLGLIQRGASPRPIDSPIWFDKNSSVGWLRISDVSRSKKYLFDTIQNLSEQGISNSRFVPKENLVMSICATVGRPILTKKDVCIHDGFVVFNNLSADKEFLYYVLSFIEQDWQKHGQTGSQMNLNTVLINSTIIARPILPEQKAIATVLSDMDTEITALEAQLHKTKAIKQGMMQELLTGKTRLV